MLAFFKINDPFRMIGIVLLFLLLRIPYMLMDLPLTQTELLWQIIGERMAQGHLMYTGIVDNTGPFSAFVYFINYFLFGNSLLAYSAISFLIILFQIFYTNHLLIKFNAFEENNYLPAFVMMVLFQLSFDFMTLSPALMGATFVLLSFGQLLNQTSINQNDTNSILLMGLYGGTAFCFHFPYLVFFPFLILTGVFINGFSLQQLLLAMTGYFLPVIICGLFYFWIDDLEPFLEIYFFLGRELEMIQHVSYLDLAFLFVLPILIAIVGYIRNNILHRMNVNQQKQNQLYLIYLVFSVCTLFFYNRLAPYQLISLIPALTYFINLFLVLTQKKLVQTVLFYAFFLIIPFMAYSWLFYKLNDPSFENYIVQTSEKHVLPSGASVWVLGTDLNYYKNSTIASPFLNYPLSKLYLEKSGEMEKWVKIYTAIRKENPDYIIDEAGIFDRWMEKIPKLKEEFSLEETGKYHREE